MKVSTNFYVLCSPLLLLATIAGAEEKGAASISASRNLATKTVCYEVQQNANGEIQVFPGPGAPPVPKSYFMNVFPQQAPAPAPTTVAYPTDWHTVPNPRPVAVPQPVPAPVPQPVPTTPTLGVAPTPGGITYPIPAPPTPDTIAFPTEPHHQCVEGSTTIFNNGEWVDIECPYSCGNNGCYGVKIHTADCGDPSNQNLCVIPRDINGNCGWCGESGTSGGTFFDAVPEENSAPASGAFVSGGYHHLMVFGFSIAVSTFVAVWA